MPTDSLDQRDVRLLTTAAVRAAVAWTHRDAQPQAWREVCRMTGVVSYVLGPAHGPIGPLDLVDLLGRPLAALVGVDSELRDLVLLDSDGNLTDAAIDIGCEYTEALFDASHDPAQCWLPAWAWQRAEQVQRAVFDRLINAGNEQDYTTTRRFLIEYPAGDERELMTRMNDVGAHRVARYEEIPPDRVWRGDTGTCWWPCPMCRWPMRVKGDLVECGYRHHEARFRIVDPASSAQAVRLAKISSARMRVPDARPTQGARCVELAVWRFITVPGVPELDLERRLLRIPGVQVAMWPGLDRVDLAVQTANGRQWEVDVKDHADPSTIVEAAPAARDVVVPDYRREQVRPLQRALPDKKIWTISGFVRHLRQHAGDAR